MPKNTSYAVCAECFDDVWTGSSLPFVEGTATIPEEPEFYQYATELRSFEACPGCGEYNEDDARRWRVVVIED